MITKDGWCSGSHHALSFTLQAREEKKTELKPQGRVGERPKIPIQFSPIGKLRNISVMLHARPKRKVPYRMGTDCQMSVQ